jgi:hypothetical protein
MQRAIKTYLRQHPGTKAKTIAGFLGVDKTEVNRALHADSKTFVQDEAHRWFLVQSDELRVELPDRWLTGAGFEDALLAAGSPLDSTAQTITFSLSKNCRILLEAMARLLALCNQLARMQRKVYLDFTNCLQTLGYLNRIGFFDHLHGAVTVLPRRPSLSSALAYDGNNHGVVELRSIDPRKQDPDIPRLLKKSFAECAGEKYSSRAFTVLSEFFDNVYEHSKAEIPGLAALQFYRRGSHLQAVISDSGMGIVGTLLPILASRYPAVDAQIKNSPVDPRVALLEVVFSNGGISQVNADGRGLGLKRSVDLAQTFKAIISVRQGTFELCIHHGATGIRFSHKLELARIEGTHICFDLSLDLGKQSG